VFHFKKAVYLLFQIGFAIEKFMMSPAIQRLPCDGCCALRLSAGRADLAKTAQVNLRLWVVCGLPWSFGV